MEKLIWEIHAMDEQGAMLVTEGERVVGSIAKGLSGYYTAEILWSGQGGDLTSDKTTLPCAIYFVRGVERATVAFRAAFSNQVPA